MKRTAFTLTELIVVISIIALLMAIFAPVLQSSRQQSKAILCGSNIKQLTVGLLIYGTENQTLPYGIDNSSRPPPPENYTGFSYDRQGWWWFNLIEGFYKNSDKESAIQCPSKLLTNPMFKDNVLCGNYGVNSSICKSYRNSIKKKEFVGTPLRTTEIPKPAETFLIVDSGYTMISWWNALDTPPFPFDITNIEDTAYVPGMKINNNNNRKLWLGQEEDALYGRHPNKTVNIGFVDGHTSHTKADDLFVEKTGNDYKNKIPLWVPK
jgi:prepilin-type N-terminal cleavage/methylation domain-containing protein/prepilin-type processing-associated H-X9-DG protein